MDISEYAKQTGTFLNAQIVSETEPTAVFKIEGEGELKENKFGNLRLYIPVKLDEENKFIFDMGKTNVKKVSEVLGMKTEAWVGSGLILDTYQTRTSEGKMTNAINVKEVKKADSATQ